MAEGHRNQAELLPGRNRMTVPHSGAGPTCWGGRPQLETPLRLAVTKRTRDRRGAREQCMNTRPHVVLESNRERNTEICKSKYLSIFKQELPKRTI